ncbi:trypsin-like serine peptidase [Bacillus cereus group sp. MYBK217-2]|uniref:trypsin-like serine peptidase n=1 Tax=Bacillus cereus group sp. MYBK217-2 TaxID=3450661 RepID=UPI003F78DD4A
MTNLNTETSTTLKNKNPIKFSQETLFDDRIRVAHPDVYPYRCFGQIEIRLKDGSSIQASGSLLSDYTVLTAGHVVKTADNKFKDIDTLRFIPAKNHSDLPYGIYDWYQMTATYNGSSRDWALISLTQPAGFRTGFLGSIAKFPVNRWVNENDHFQHVGYPGDHVDEM